MTRTHQEECRTPVTLADLLARQAERSPESTFLIGEQEELSYGEVDRRVSSLAARLSELGAGSGQLVGLVLPRSSDLVIAALAAARAGAAFLSIDPSYPADRISYMREDANPTVLCVTRSVGDTLPERAGEQRVVVDEPALVASLRAPSRSDRPVRRAAVEDLAYVVYTSGSTGRPKGVAVTHAGLPPLAAAVAEAMAVDSSSRLLQFSSPGFDAFVAELATVLYAGAALVVPPAVTLIGDTLAGVLSAQQVTHAILPPTAAAGIAPESVPHLRTVCLVGEAAPGDLVARWAPQRRVLNAYGPTEATVCATISSPLAGAGTPPIGRPIGGVHVHVLDEHQQPVDAGEVGELYLAGTGLARGYLRRPALTAERFVDNPFPGEGDRMYRTGDLVRIRPDGELEFHGREDRQVKLRGFRIELGEVESVLRTHADVEQAVAVVLEDRQDHRRIVAYLVPPAGSVVPSTAELRAHAARSLPGYMVPAAFVALAALPTTPHGKLDERALPAPERVPVVPASEAPGAPAERVFRELFEELLGVSASATSNFFHLGGDSLQVITLIRRARAHGLMLSPTQVMDDPTPEGLAAAAAATTTPQEQEVKA